MTASWETQIKAQIRRRYAAQAPQESGAEKAIAAGYPAALIAELPPALVAHYSGCGYLFEDLSFGGGETVVDLGAGAGLDSVIAARQVPNGRVISLDMTFEMLKKVNSRQSAINLLRLCGDLEGVPLGAASADIVIANASFNLALDKAKAFAEAFRILKPGGRLVARDLIKTAELPPEILTDPLSYNTSLGGALAEAALVLAIEKAGFEEIAISDHRPFSYVHSVKIAAIKP